MNVVNIEVWKQAAPVLEDLAGSVDRDLVPLLSTEGGAPHTITREFSCYVDYLGALYTGQVDNVGSHFKAFLSKVMKKTDEGYKTYAEVIYQMYRNGPVHGYDPKQLYLADGPILGWIEYHGPRRNTVIENLQGWEGHRVSHLELTQGPIKGRHWFLLVSTNSLLEDLKQGIERLMIGVGSSEERVAAWNRAAAGFEAMRHVGIKLNQLR